MRLERRRLLRALLGMSLAGPALLPTLLKVRPALAEDILVDSLRRKIRHRHSAAAICKRAGLQSYAARDLVRRLCPDPAERASLAASTPDRAAAWLRQAIEDDFTRNRTVTVEGWILSESEVLAAAIVAKQ